MMSTNHFFLLSFNPWPTLISLILFNMFFSFLNFIKFYEFMGFFSCLLICSLASFSWWINYSKEFNLEGKDSWNLESGVKLGMILFVTSEVLFFFSFFWSYFHFYLSPNLECGLTWPIPFTLTFDPLGVPLINTLVLLSSGVTVTLSHFYLNKNYKILSLFFLFLTFTLGIVFSILQGMEYKNSFFTISDSTFGTVFFVLTGFHGMHVLIGSIFLVVVFMRLFSLYSPSGATLSFELASWYWHFVDVVWIFLYFFLYYLNSI